MPKIGIVKSNFNKDITDNMLKQAIDFLDSLPAGKAGKKIEHQIIEVPGAFEIPLALKKMIDSNKFDCLTTIGCLIKGQTKHFDVIANSVTEQISNLSVNNNIPIAFGIITANKRSQALKRTNLGLQATKASIQLYENIRKF
ncbi:MAG: 6,7-dimethyl-8-ribityllumazine synthase [Patescibacteria group bacterium]